MLACNRIHPGQEMVAAPSRHQRWHRHTLSSIDAGVPILDTVVAAMALKGFSEKDRFGMHLALEEAVVNAFRHGNRHDPSKQVTIRYRLTAGRLLAQIEDQGAGFDPRRVPDPTTAENQDRESGRGLFLMRHYATSIRHNARGNRVTLCKRPTGIADQPTRLVA